MNILQRYMYWLHTMYPMGTVERLPVVNEDGTTNVPGLLVAGDLAGVPLLKFSQHSGAMAVRRILPDLKPLTGEVLDVAIIGAGVGGISAALECAKNGLKYAVFESAEPLSTIVNFPKKKPIYVYPTEMQPAGDLKITANVREDLIEELAAQVQSAEINIISGRHVTHIERSGCLLHVKFENHPNVAAQRVIVAIGRSGNYRRLNVPGEDLGKVSNRLHDPADYRGRNVMVVGGGDSAVEAAIALAREGAAVTLVHRGAELSRPKQENIEALRAVDNIRTLLNTTVLAISENEVELSTGTIANDNVFVLIGREAPLDFFRRSGVPIHGEWRAARMLAFAAFLLFCIFLYHWKAGGFLTEIFSNNKWFPFNLNFSGGSALSKALAISLQSPSFYYTLAYSLIIIVFGWRRIRRRKTPYITAQTVTLTLIQVIPLFLLPEIILPWLGQLGLFDSGVGRVIADNLFPVVNYGHGREYWRAVGFILAWPLFIYNVFTEQPLLWWLIISCLQTFVVIPAIIYFWGKGAYCGWICSCGALAETLGDGQRMKMPHGPLWSKLNMAGQAILWAAIALLILRVGAWIWPASFAAGWFNALLSGANGFPINYKWIVDVTLAGIVGVGFYFWYSGRVWCRFFCPLAALMHIYAKFSRFRIIPEKKRCISCNVCTSVCHQGIDVMNFANKGIAMEDPECVRCSACVHACPTGVLRFGQVDSAGKVIHYDLLEASPVLMAERRGSNEGGRTARDEA